jgi:hypothetical protein
MNLFRAAGSGVAKGVSAVGSGVGYVASGIGKGASAVGSGLGSAASAAERAATTASRYSVNLATGEPVGQGSMSAAVGHVFDKVTDILPASMKTKFAGSKCDMSQCMAGKIFLGAALVGVALGFGSWGNIIGNLVFELVMLVIVGWMCRTCNNAGAWAAVAASIAVPLAIMVALKATKKK